MSGVTLMLAILAAVQIIHHLAKEPAVEKRTRDFGAKSIKEAECRTTQEPCNVVRLNKRIRCFANRGAGMGSFVVARMVPPQAFTCSSPPWLTSPRLHWV